MNGKERREWTRYELKMTAHINRSDSSQPAEVKDFSAGGASLSGAVANNNDHILEVSMKEFGNLPASVIRDWDDGFSVMFDLDEDDKHSLQEDIDSFMRENDLMDY